MFLSVLKSNSLIRTVMIAAVKSPILADKALLFFLMAYYIIAYFFPYLFWFKVSFIIFGVIGYGLFLLSEILNDKEKLVPLGQGWPLIWLSLFSLWAIFNLTDQLGIAAIKDMAFFFIVALPMMLLATSRIINNHEISYLIGLFLFFMSIQLVIVFGQMALHLTGYGFYLPATLNPEIEKHYLTMLTGSFFNANDLGAVSLMIAAFFLVAKTYSSTAANTNLETKLKAKLSMLNLGLIIATILILLTASRSAMMILAITLVIFSLRQSWKKGLLVLVLLSAIVSIFVSIGSEHFNNINFVQRVIWRLESLIAVLTGAAASDNSIVTRLDSYINFIIQLPVVGLGSGILRDYTIFVEPIFKSDLYYVFAVNPHSFFVEIGYWLGWPGLILFSLFLTSYEFDFYFLFVVFVFVMTGMISSSVINNFMFFMAFLSVMPLFHRQRLS